MMPSQSHAGSNRLGLHLPDAYDALSQANLGATLEMLRTRQVGWAYLIANTDQALPADGLQQLSDAGIAAVVHLPNPISATNSSTLNPILKAYAEARVRHVIVYDRPNMKSTWAGAGWQQQGLTERFLDRIVPVLQASHSVGLHPTLPPLQPGGDYWDLAFLEAVLRGAARRLPVEVLNQLVIASYVQPHGKPADWGKGGPAAWPKARPYLTPDGHQDHLGVNLPEWYEAAAHKALARSLPQLAIFEAKPSDPADASSTQVVEVARKMAGDPHYAPFVKTMCFPDLPEAAVADAVEMQAKQVLASVTQDKPLDHYLLLPDDEQHSVRIWRQASAYAIRTRVTVGFSIAEAACANKVTLAGDLEQLPTAIEAKLRLAGCDVERVTAWPVSAAQVAQSGEAGKGKDSEVGS